MDDLKLSYEIEENVKCNKRILRWDMVVNTKDGKFFIESDGEQHFSLKVMTRISRNCPKSEVRFKDQRTRDLLKEKYIRDNNKLLFRFSFRQTREIPQLVEKMLKMNSENKKGVVYMDDIYWGKNIN